eukprot:TRINITY_DN3127_c0_g1_i2.p1 TRINITY_DN3127_c0_g1~~TRINITY_DN3127_c0_g1_i2.p1  ORF type:complete len:266 (-),score=37.42 TRINITY_DN3127_c0_g1_i2:26-823(-)
MSIDPWVERLDNNPNFKTIFSFLKFLRENNLRQSALATKYGSILLNKYPSKLGSDFWSVTEQVFIAALDSGDINTANKCLASLEKRFPKSIRVKRLRGLSYEHSKKYSEATQLYKELLSANPTDTFAMKRQICIAKAKGKISNAILLLNEYLKIFMGDQEAWMELAELYISEQLYQYAAFCYEEVLLSSPENYHFYVKYAEVLYTIGGDKNYELALKYYSHALELSENNNTRAFYGLCLTLHAIDKKGISLKVNQQDLYLSLIHI